MRYTSARPTDSNPTLAPTEWLDPDLNERLAIDRTKEESSMSGSRLMEAINKPVDTHTHTYKHTQTHSLTHSHSHPDSHIRTRTYRVARPGPERTARDPPDQGELKEREWVH